MQMLLRHVRQSLSPSQSSQEAARVLHSVVFSAPSGELHDGLAELWNSFAGKGKGSLLVSVLNKRIDEDAEVQSALLLLVKDPAGELNLRVTLLSSFDESLRRRPIAVKQDYFRTLRAIVTASREDRRIRAHALRALGVELNEENLNVIRSMLIGNPDNLADAAAYALLDSGLALTEDFILLLLEQLSALSTPLLFEIPGVLRLIGELQDTYPAARRLVEAWITWIKNIRAEMALILLKAAGYTLTTNQIGVLLHILYSHDVAHSEPILRGLFASWPRTIRTLYRSGYRNEYAYGVMKAPESEESSCRPIFDAMVSDEDKQVAGWACFIRSLGLWESTATSQTEEVQAPQSAASSSISHGFSSGFQPGDAIYKDLSEEFTGYGIVDNHWHAGLVIGFRWAGKGIGILEGIHVHTPITDVVQRFSVSACFDNPNADLVSIMSGTHRDFIHKFTEGETYHGARCAPRMSQLERRRICSTALALEEKGVWYTLGEQLGYAGEEWDGTPVDVRCLRCDGLVEYAYERNGIRVCSGRDLEKWDISVADKAHAHNHDTLHFSGSDGLCPRIQSGDTRHGQGAQTSFIKPTHELPIVQNLSVTSTGKFPTPIPHISIKTSSESSMVFTRLRVKKTSETGFRFVVTEIPDTTMRPEFPRGGWILKGIYANRGVSAWWLGKTVDGTDYRGQNGEYEFRLQLIDEGGNVSREHSVATNIRW